jgi:hypothetical protein
MADETATAGSRDATHEFMWVAEGEPVRGGQWCAFDGSDPVPVALADVVAAHAPEGADPHPIEVHVRAAEEVVEAAGDLEDRLFPDPGERLYAALASVDAGEPQIDPESPDGVEVRLAAEALEKLAADLAELVEEELANGSLATLPPMTTRALCQTVQTGWRLRRLVDPPSVLAL